MTLYKSFVIGAALILGLTFQSCENAKEDRRDDKENRKESTHSTRDYNRDIVVYRDQTGARIQENNRRIRALRNENAAQGSEMNQDRMREVERIENQNRTLEDKLKKFQADSEESWQKFKADFNREMEKLENEINDLTSSD